jgi:hypothetical protein
VLKLPAATAVLTISISLPTEPFSSAASEGMDTVNPTSIRVAIAIGIADFLKRLISYS